MQKVLAPFLQVWKYLSPPEHNVGNGTVLLAVLTAVKNYIQCLFPETMPQLVWIIPRPQCGSFFGKQVYAWIKKKEPNEEKKNRALEGKKTFLVEWITGVLLSIIHLYTHVGNPIHYGASVRMPVSNKW